MGHIQTIVAAAKGYKGQEEIQPNQGFKDPSFAAKMLAVGFYKGASWCGFYVMVVLFGAYADAPEILKYLKAYCSPSTHTMWANFRASKEVITGQIPKLGAVAIWQEGSGTNGHTGIVIGVSPDNRHFVCSEGNSNSDGSRNGYEVSENLHTVGKPFNPNGLNLLGFAYMPD